MRQNSPCHFAVFRLAFGLYLGWHFASLIPYGSEIFSNEGMLADYRLNLTYRIFPSIFYWFDSPLFVTTWLAVSALLSLFFAAGIQRRLISVLLWYSWASLFNRNILIANPSIPYVGFLLLACSLIPSGEGFSLGRTKERTKNWEIPPIIFYGTWALMALGYTISGLHKLTSPSWVDGSALIHLLRSPLARDSFFRELLLALPQPLMALKTWGVLAIEIGFLPLCFFSRGRMLASGVMVGLHLGIVFLVSFADLSCGMLLLHLFTIDPSWLRTPAGEISAKIPPHIVFYDGSCGVCNRFIHFLMGEDPQQLLRYAPLQGSTAAGCLHQRQREQVDSIVYLSYQVSYQKSSAVLRILMDLGGIFTLAARVLLVVPRPLRDWCYDCFAKRRHRFGKSSCPLLAPEERRLFLA